MSDNRDLLNLLQQNNASWITAKALAMKLGVSERTVKSRIAQLRKSNIAIKSGPAGYKIKNNSINMTTESNLLPHTIKQRNSWLIRKLLKNNKVNVYDLSAQLYINDVELRKELKELGKNFNNFNLRLKHNGDTYKLIGKEKDKRKMLSSMIYSELNGTLLNEKTIQEYFPDIQVGIISKILNKNLKSSNLKADSFDFSNILLHLVIMIDRTNKSNQEQETVDLKNVTNITIKNLLIDLKNDINASLSYDDVKQLTEMLQLLSDDHKIKMPKNEQINKLFKWIVLFVRKTYDLDLDENLFKKRFLPHLIRLIDRFKNNSVIHNPLAENIKNSSPTIYECASLIAYVIKDSLGIAIGEEEIAFIALHVGNIVAEQIRNENRIICQLFMPDYHGNVAATISVLNKKFGNDIVLLNAISDKSDILTETQLVIVSDSKEIIENHNFVQVSSFLLPNDINKLQKAIKQIKNSTLSQGLQKGLSKFTSKSDFIRNTDYETAKEVIHYISERFIKENVVNSNFEDKILEREKLSSTAFGSVAVPHTINYNSKISRWFIYINPKGIRWGDQTIYLVIALATSSKDEKKFRKVFDELSEVIIDDNKVSKLIDCKTYKEFVNEIVKVKYFFL